MAKMADGSLRASSGRVATSSRAILTSEQATFQACGRAWWLVEADSADAARRCIAFEKDNGVGIEAWSMGGESRMMPGRILASGGRP